MNNDNFYRYQSETKAAIESAQQALDRIKATQSHLYRGQCAAAIFDLVDSARQLSELHDLRTL